ncbi:cellulose binding domain-containing protein [Micromonospora sp. WMMD718]|nr:MULTISPECIES: cellulose binding domain-containing protein [unclassified Micromonospora]MDG4750281.1 cellulose binding domain-containing protein [Micromonospora sp. WMMD718]
MTVTNTGATAWSAWRLTLRFTAGQQIRQGWSGRFSQSART